MLIRRQKSWEKQQNLHLRTYKKSLKIKGHANLMLATGASQFTFLDALKNTDSLDWSKITTFHLDEYIGISPDYPASFRRYLHDRITDEVQPGEAYFLEGDADDFPKEIERYEKLLEAHPINIACIGIGENGHFVFNDPPAGDLEDSHLVKVVELANKLRQQQVGKGWFGSIEEVLTQALSVTIPAIMRDVIRCVVPDSRKAGGFHDALYGPLSTDCPASVLRTHPNRCSFFISELIFGAKSQG